MSKINTDDMRKALDGLDTCRNGWGLLYKDGGQYGPWGPSKSNGDPTVKPQLDYSAADFPDSMVDSENRAGSYARRCLEIALMQYMPKIVADAQQRARSGIEIHEKRVADLAAGKRVS